MKRLFTFTSHLFLFLIYPSEFPSLEWPFVSSPFDCGHFQLVLKFQPAFFHLWQTQEGTTANPRGEMKNNRESGCGPSRCWRDLWTLPRGMRFISAGCHFQKERRKPSAEGCSWWKGCFCFFADLLWWESSVLARVKSQQSGAGPPTDRKPRTVTTFSWHTNQTQSVHSHLKLPPIGSLLNRPLT